MQLSSVENNPSLIAMELHGVDLPRASRHIFSYMASSLTMPNHAGALSDDPLKAALKAAKSYTLPEPSFTANEAEAGLRRAQALFRVSNMCERDLVDELIPSRRTD